jgi:hypothetical protein
MLRFHVSCITVRLLWRKEQRICNIFEKEVVCLYAQMRHLVDLTSQTFLMSFRYALLIDLSFSWCCLLFFGTAHFEFAL